MYQHVGPKFHSEFAPYCRIYYKAEISVECWTKMLYHYVAPLCWTNLLYHFVVPTYWTKGASSLWNDWQTNESTIAEFTSTPKLVWNVGPTSWYNMFIQLVVTTLQNEFAPLKLESTFIFKHQFNWFWKTFSISIFFPLIFFFFVLLHSSATSHYSIPKSYPIWT